MKVICFALTVVLLMGEGTFAVSTERQEDPEWCEVAGLREYTIRLQDTAMSCIIQEYARQCRHAATQHRETCNKFCNQVGKRRAGSPICHGDALPVTDVFDPATHCKKKKGQLTVYCKVTASCDCKMSAATDSRQASVDGE